jgi:tripeptide aminopeptidase
MNLDRLIANASEIQQIPAPTFSEAARSAFTEQAFKRVGLLDVSVDDLGNVFGRIGAKLEPSVVVSAHLDSVFPLDIPLEIHRDGSLLIGPGIGDNAIAIAYILEIADSLIMDEPLDGCIWFVANVREEGLGNLQGMHKVVDRFGAGVNAYIVLEGLGLGHIYHRGLYVRRYRVSVETQGGHAWIHAGRSSAIHNLVAIGAEVVQLPKPENVQTSLNIGSIKGGTSINTIAGSASFDLDLRSEEPGVLNNIERHLQKICRRYQSSDVKVKQELIGNRPGGGISHDHALVHLTCEALQAGEITECKLGIASTDANVPLSKGYPAVCVGLTQGGHAHTTEEYIDIETIPHGYKMLHHLILNALKLEA